MKAKCILNEAQHFKEGLGKLMIRDLFYWVTILMNPLRVRIYDINTHKVETSFLDMFFTSLGMF